jgi:hypothetical protein
MILLDFIVYNGDVVSAVVVCAVLAVDAFMHTVRQ